jgi:ethanolamine utilization protein EutN
VQAIPRGAFLEVVTDDGAKLIAFDVLGTGIGERVLIATGSVASGWFAPEHPPIDALIIGSLDPERDAGQSASARTGGGRTAQARRTRTTQARQRATKEKRT